jgi:hypothetical protein
MAAIKTHIQPPSISLQRSAGGGGCESAPLMLSRTSRDTPVHSAQPGYTITILRDRRRLRNDAKFQSLVGFK